jgi:hypothetical protein
MKFLDPEKGLSRRLCSLEPMTMAIGHWESPMSVPGWTVIVSKSRVESAKIS